MKQLNRWIATTTVVGSVVYLIAGAIGILTHQNWWLTDTMLLAQVAAGIILALVPYVWQRLGKFGFPSLLMLLYQLFILFSVLLGSGMQAYSIPYWDKGLHLFSATLLAGLGLAVCVALTKKADRPHLNPLLLAIFALSFGTFFGVLWEFYEFTGDGVMGLNMQRFAVGNTPLVGRAALMDTMGDLFMDVFGSALLAVVAYFGVGRDRRFLDLFTFTKDCRR